VSAPAPQRAGLPTAGRLPDAGPGPGSVPVVPGAGAPLDRGGFLHRREIPAGKAGVSALQLDAAVLAHSAGGFADLRIVTADHRQVPYVLERLDGLLSVRLPALETWTSSPSEGGSGRTTTYLVRLPYPNLAGARLSFSTNARVFQRAIRLQPEPGPMNTDRRTLATASWSHGDAGTPAPDLTFDIGSIGSTRLFLAVEDGDNAPLQIERPTLLLPRYQLRFVRRTTAPLELLYGNPRLKAPRYDVSLMAASLLDAQAEQVSPGPEQEGPLSAPRATFVFWGALVAAVVVLLALIVRLLRPESQGRKE
jgi:hypothetical protein